MRGCARLKPNQGGWMVMGRDARGKVGGEMGVRPQAEPELGVTSPSTKVFNNIINRI